MPVMLRVANFGEVIEEVENSLLTELKIDEKVIAYFQHPSPVPLEQMIPWKLNFGRRVLFDLVSTLSVEFDNGFYPVTLFDSPVVSRLI
jgi:hypothetical protein